MVQTNLVPSIWSKPTSFPGVLVEDLHGNKAGSDLFCPSLFCIASLYTSSFDHLQYNVSDQKLEV